MCFSVARGGGGFNQYLSTHYRAFSFSKIRENYKLSIQFLIKCSQGIVVLNNSLCISVFSIQRSVEYVAKYPHCFPIYYFLIRTWDNDRCMKRTIKTSAPALCYHHALCLSCRKSSGETDGTVLTRTSEDVKGDDLISCTSFPQLKFSKTAWT